MNRFARAALAAFAPVALLAGCNSSPTSTTQTTATTSSTTAPGAASSGTTAAGSLLDRVTTSHTLTVCTPGDYLPYSLLDKTTNTYKGLDIDLVTTLATSLDAKPVFVKSSWKTLSADFTSKCDIAVGGISGSLPRARIAFFSPAILQDGKTPITKCSNLARYDTIAEINQPGVRSISPEGGTNQKFAQANYPKGTLVLWQDNTTIFDQILAGKADVMTTDATEARWAQKNHPGLCAAHPDKPFTHDQKVWLLPRGDEDFQQYVTQWFTSITNSGELAATLARWMA